MIRDWCWWPDKLTNYCACCTTFRTSNYRGSAGSKVSFSKCICKTSIKKYCTPENATFSTCSSVNVNSARYFGAASVPATSWVYDSNCPADTPPFGLGKWIEVFVFEF